MRGSELTRRTITIYHDSLLLSPLCVRAKVYTGLAIASFAVVAASQFGLLPSSFSGGIVADGSLNGMDYALFAIPVAAFGGGAFFKLRSDEVFQTMDATKKAMNATQAMMIESQNRGRVFTGITVLSFSIAILSQLGSLEFASVSADNPATYKLKETSTVMPYKSLDSLKAPEIEVPTAEPTPVVSKDVLPDLTESEQTAAFDVKTDEYDIGVQVEYEGAEEAETSDSDDSFWTNAS